MGPGGRTSASASSKRAAGVQLSGRSVVLARSYALPGESRALRAARFLNDRINAQVWREDVGLVLPQPEGFGRRIVGTHPVAGDLVNPFAPDALADRCRLCLGALVGPDNGCAQWPALGVHR